MRNPDDRTQLFALVRRMEDILASGDAVRFDFTKTSRLYPCGTLFLVAKVLLALDKHTGRITCDYPTDDVVDQLFQHIGLLQQLGLKPRKRVTAENVRYWDFVTGHTTDTSQFEGLLTHYQKTFPAHLRMGLYDSMSEAVTNSIHHAYTGKRMDEQQKNWWMFAEQRADKLHVAICDLGVGIAESLRQKPELADQIRKLTLGRRRHDKHLLGAAVGSRRSRTRLEHRGKGLPDMLEFVRDGAVGGFFVYSNHGAFVYDASTSTERVKDFAEPFPGTLIQWELSLQDGS